MFDEYDEGKAIAPASDSYLTQPTDQFFLTLSADGDYLSPDFYLRLTDEANQMLSNQIPLFNTFSTPFSAAPMFLRTSVELGYCAQPDWINTVEPTTAITNVTGNGPNNIPVCQLQNTMAFSGTHSILLDGVDNEAILPSHCYSQCLM